MMTVHQGSATGSDWSKMFNNNIIVYQYLICTQCVPQCDRLITQEMNSVKDLQFARALEVSGGGDIFFEQAPKNSGARHLCSAVEQSVTPTRGRRSFETYRTHRCGHKWAIRPNTSFVDSLPDRTPR